VIHYGLDPPDSTLGRGAARALLGDAAPDRPLVAFGGRLIHQKGVDVLLNAWQSVNAEHPDAHLLLIGDGPLRGALETQAHRMGLAARVTFAGWRTDAASLIPAFEFIVMPSRWEGFGLVALETMAQHRALIASRASALPEIVSHEQTGLLVEPEDAAGLATAILRLLREPALAQAYGDAGYQRLVTSFSTARMIEQTDALYKRICNQGVA
jgi:glycosyltransferase involved in cell wall biosynthesis